MLDLNTQKLPVEGVPELETRVQTKGVKYPFFLSLCKYTLERYWHDVLQNCAKGSFPKGLRFDGIDTFTTDLKEKVVLPKDPIKAWRLCYSVFSKMGMRVPYSVVAPPPVEQNVENDWKKIRTKHSKDIVILKFVAYLKKEHKLKSTETKQVLGLIQLALSLNAISHAHIKMIDGSITEIEGLKFDVKHRRFVYPLSSSYEPLPKGEVAEAAPTKKKKKLEGEVDKYVRHLSTVATLKKRAPRTT